MIIMLNFLWITFDLSSWIDVEKSFLIRTLQKNKRISKSFSRLDMLPTVAFEKLVE